MHRAACCWNPSRNEQQPYFGGAGVITCDNNNNNDNEKCKTPRTTFLSKTMYQSKIKPSQISCACPRVSQGVRPRPRAWKLTWPSKGNPAGGARAYLKINRPPGSCAAAGPGWEGQALLPWVCKVLISFHLPPLTCLRSFQSP